MGSPTQLDRHDLIDAICVGGRIDDETLLDAYDRLEGVDVEFMLGTWRGGVFHYDHPFGRELQRIDWYGKRFRGADDVEPLLCRGAEGTIASWDGHGLARLREMRFRGRVSVAMLYDQRPLIDHFRRVSDDVVVGLADQKGKPATYLFHLTRVSEPDVP